MSPEKQKLVTILATVVDKLHGEEGKQGERGEKGDKGDKGEDSTVAGPQGPAGLNGKDGKDGKDGINGKDGAKGPKGDKGPAGKDGKDGINGKDGNTILPETIIEVAMPIIVQNVHKAVGSKTYDASEIRGLAEFVADNSGGADTFETVSKNLDASGATLNYTGDNLTSIVYTNGITKTLNYTGDNLTSVVLSGSTPSGIDLTKTLSYTGDNLTEVTYS